MSLSIVYPPQGSLVEPEIDIVAVHGLGGDAVRSWTHYQSNAFWLKDFLPKRIPDARVLSFGYDSAAALGDSTSRVVDHAKSLLGSMVDKRETDEEKARPLIIIAHSLGAILVKQALLLARLEPRYEQIHTATIGIIFFGAPHRGSEKAIYAKVLANITQAITHKPLSPLVKTLQTNSRELQQLTTDFRHQLPRYQIISFYEQRPMRHYKQLIVEKHSAVLDVDNEEQIPVHADHSTICKFENEDDTTFEKVWKRIQRMRNEPQQTRQPQAASFNIHYEVPHLLSPVFTGRDEIYQCLEASLGMTKITQRLVQRRFVLYGMGGSGKTQICLKYIQSHRERYWGIFWIDASTDVSIKQSVNIIAILLQVDPDIESVKRALANSQHMWLMVLDNADDPNLHLSPNFPTGSRGDIIITSRNPDCCQYNTVGTREVRAMSSEDSTDLLLKIVHDSASIGEVARNDAFLVVQALGYLALAVSQAGAYIRETSCSLRDYLELYRRRREEIWAYRPKHTGTDYKHTVYTTWQVSLDMLASMQDVTSQCALKLLKVICFYHHDQIPLSLFLEAWSKRQQHQKDFDWAPWPKGVLDVVELRCTMQLCVSLLVSYSLVSRGLDDSLSLHPLMHEWCRERLSKEEQGHSCHRALVLLTISIKPGLPDQEYNYRRKLLPHILACLHEFELRGLKIDSADDINDHLNVSLWHILFVVLTDNRVTAKAVTMCEQYLQIDVNCYGHKHDRTVSSMNELAYVYRDVGRLEEARELMENVLKKRSSESEQQDPDTIIRLSNLARIYNDLGRLEEAQKSMEYVIQILKSTLGEYHLDTLMSMLSLANMYNKVGKQGDAITLAETVLMKQKIILGEEHRSTLESMRFLAHLYGELGRGEGLALAERVYRLQTSKLGEDHPDTLASMHELAWQYYAADRAEEALIMAKQLVQVRKSSCGHDHHQTLRSMQSLSCIYFKLGRRQDALNLTELVVRCFKTHYGEKHPDTVVAINNLAKMKAQVGKEQTPRRTIEPEHGNASVGQLIPVPSDVNNQFEHLQIGESSNTPRKRKWLNMSRWLR